MEIIDILEDLKFYLDQYKRKNYCNNQFKWLDNVQRVKDKKISALNNELIVAIKNK